jgi:hypothetical protein
VVSATLLVAEGPRIALMLPICRLRISAVPALLPRASVLSRLSSRAWASAASLARSAALWLLVSFMTLRRNRMFGLGRFAGLREDCRFREKREHCG